LQDLAAIKVKRAKHGRIQDVHILNSFFGIYLEYAKHYTLINNKIEGQITNEANAGNAIHIWKGDFITVKGNELTGHRDGIYFEFVNESIISYNNSHHNIRYGLHFMFSNNDEYLNNTFTENSAGVAVMFSNHIKMKSNKFALNWGGASYGLLLKEISDGEISDNLFYKNTIGILAEGANRLHIERNQFTSNGSALNMKGNCLDNTIAFNNFLANTFEVVTNSRYSQNTYSHNYWSKYKSYDLNRDGIGDEAYRPVEIFSKVTDVIPASTILLHSFLIDMLNLGERLFPEVIPADLIDLEPMIKPYSYDRHSSFK
jgi:nitrous oxidase accessory protein